MKTRVQMSANIKRMVTLGMLSAAAFLVMLIQIPISSAEFLKFEAKDVVIVIGGFIYGPLASFLMSVVVSLLEMPVTGTGPIGLVMNILSTCAFACTAAFIYKRRQRLSGAVAGLIAGVVAMVVAMLLWNYFITPMYMGIPRDAVAAMLVPVFLPFNLIKGVLNAAITMLLYKPLVLALRKANLIPPEREGALPGEEKKGLRVTTGTVLVSLLVLASCVLLVLVQRGII